MPHILKCLEIVRTIVHKIERLKINKILTKTFLQVHSGIACVSVLNE